jgi:hypothetical protein
MARFTTAASEKTSAKSDWLATFKTGDTKIRFLQETGDFREYWEHWYDGGSVPCTRDKSTCPCCQSNDEKVRSASRKFGVNAIERSTGVVKAYKIPVSLYNRLVTRAQRNDDTLLNRDYVIIRSGAGLDTEYDVEQGEKYEVDVADYALLDVDKILGSVWEAKFGGITITENTEVVVEDDVVPFDQSVSNDTKIIDESDLFKMTIPALHNVAIELEIEPKSIKEASTKSKLISLILNAS